MYYEDQSRRFNLVTGLLSGAVLGAGVALILLPDRGRPGHVRRAVDQVGRSASRRLEALRDDLSARLPDSTRAGLNRFRS